MFTAGETGEYTGESAQEEAAVDSGETGAREEAAVAPGETGARVEAALRDGSVSGGVENPGEAKARLAVYVCGQVNVPGVYELEEGSRIGDAIELAGGMAEEAAADALNLAQPLSDGLMIRIPSVEEMEKGGAGTVMVSGGTGEAGTAGSGGTLPGDGGSLVSINKATKEQLMTLPGIGESKAEAILSYRQEYGGFGSVEEIMNISGIKEGVYLKIKDKITI